MKYIAHPFLTLPVDEDAVAHDRQVRALLKSAGAWSDAELVLEEFCLPGQAVRADLVVTGEALTGFEIKAGKDGMGRLASQAKAYGAVCGFAHVATVPDHVNDVASMVPDWWGVWVASGWRRDLAVRCVRKARPNPSRDPVDIAAVLWRDETISKLTELGLAKGTSGDNKTVLAQKLARAMSAMEIDAYVQACLRLRPVRIATPKAFESTRALPRSAEFALKRRFHDRIDLDWHPPVFHSNLSGLSQSSLNEVRLVTG